MFAISLPNQSVASVTAASGMEYIYALGPMGDPTAPGLAYHSCERPCSLPPGPAMLLLVSMVLVVPRLRCAARDAVVPPACQRYMWTPHLTSQPAAHPQTTLGAARW